MKLPMREVHIHYFGSKSYQEGQALQEEFIQQVKTSPNKIFILGFDFDPVITLGKRASEKEDVLGNSEIPIYPTERGGLATLHSPGQLVIYPICNIKFQPKITLKNWVQLLLQHTTNQLIQTFPEYKNFLAPNGVGIFLNHAKVVSLGLRINHSISSHGLAINLKNDVSLFSKIRPCGVNGQEVKNLGYEGDLASFFLSWCEGFKTLLQD